MTLRKTEKTHMGSIVEINLHREFEFADGDATDYRIDGIEVDCKFSQSLGGWELPPESVGHLCLLVWANDDSSRWEAGLVRVPEAYLRPGRGNRDGKRRLTIEGESRILWLYGHPTFQRTCCSISTTRLGSGSSRRVVGVKAAKHASMSSSVRSSGASSGARLP